MSEVFKIELSGEHLQRKSNVKCNKAIFEIVWNAIDADANNILISTQFDGEPNAINLHKLVVSDDGHGLGYDEINESLKTYGKSKKSDVGTSPSGRKYHGRLGEGRYTYFSLGKKVVWDTRHNENGNIANLIITFSQINASLEVNNEQNTDKNIGTDIIISELTEDAKNYLLKSDLIKDDLIKEFAPFLIGYPSINIFVNDEKINIESSIKSKRSFSRTLDNYTFIIDIYKWNNIKSGELMLLNEHKNTLRSIDQKGIPSDLSIYISSLFFDEKKSSGELDVIELDQIWENIQTFILESINSFSIENRIENNIEFINEMKKTGIYPFNSDNTSIEEETSRKVFDVVATKLNEISPNIKNANKETRKLTYSLLKTAIQERPSSLKKILSEVYKLSKNEQDEFADLLDSVTLSSMISTIGEIKNRLSFLEELKAIVYTDVGNHIKERTEFQPLLLSQLWIFGNDYIYGVDDISLRNVLKEFCAHIGLSDIELTDDDKNNTDFNKIPDIVLWRKIKFGDVFENLVIEIKKPNKVLGTTELDQIKKYRNVIKNDPRFSPNGYRWKFILIGNDIDDDVKTEIRSWRNGIQEIDNSQLIVMTWSDLIAKNEMMYDFYKEQTNIVLNEEDIKVALNKRWNNLFGKDKE